MNPLLLPELCYLLSSIYLASDSKSLSRCSRVSRSWYAAFNPILWRTFSASQLPSQTSLSFDAIDRNAHHIQHLRIGRMAGREHMYPFETCQSLRTLRIEDERTLSDWDGFTRWLEHTTIHEPTGAANEVLNNEIAPRKGIWIQLLILLIRQNPSLYKLHLTMERFEPTVEFWRTLSAASDHGHSEILLPSSTSTRIEHLECVFTRIPHSHIEVFLDAFSNLETLVIQHCTFDPNFPLELLRGKRPYPRLRALTLATNTGLDLATQIELIRLFPEINSLSWSIMGTQHLVVSEFCALLSKDCRKIESLVLSDRNLESSHLSRILDSIPRLTRFFLRFDTLSSMFNDLDVMRAMRRHFPTLTDVEFGQVRSSVRCATVFEFLRGCPNLQRLAAFGRLDCSRQGMLEQNTSTVPTTVAAEVSTDATSLEPATPLSNQAALDDFVKDSPWVCLGMKQLHMILTGDSQNAWQNRTLQQHLFLQLGRLKELQTLSLGHCILWMYENGFSYHGLNFTVDAGLAKLAGLEKLEQLNIEGIYQHLEERDVEWMLEHWPKLKVVEGELHHKKDKREKLDAIMEQSGFKILHHSYRRK